MILAGENLAKSRTKNFRGSLAKFGQKPYALYRFIPHG